MSIKHGIYIQEEATDVQVAQTGSSSIQVVVGTAPVNMAENPSEVVNVPILANSATEAMAALGYSVDFQKYTLCQTMYATANLFQASPVVYINVLDPKKHKKDLTEAEYQINQKQAVIEKEGIILDGLTVKNATGDVALTLDTDYSAAFDSTTGFLTITMIAGGKGENATAIKVSGSILDPDAVKKEDIIGAVDPSTGAETGAQLIRQVYPRLGVVPGLIIAPGWSQIPEVGLALIAKAALINGVFRSMALVDLDTTKAKKYTDTKKVKEDSGYTSPHCYPLWPCDRAGEYILAKSAVVGAAVEYIDAGNDDVPNLSPSNHLLGVTGQCLADGTEVVVDQDQANTVNSYGVATAINQNGYRLWGNYTGAYPASADAKDIWFPVRRMFNWQGNNFIQTYFDKVDNPMNNVLVQSVVDSENIRCSAYAPKYWAGASIEYLTDDNPKTSILAGKMVFRQHIAPYTPAQDIENILDYDTDALASAVGGK